MWPHWGRNCRHIYACWLSQTFLHLAFYQRLDASKATPLMLFEWTHVLGIGSLAGLILSSIWKLPFQSLGLITQFTPYLRFSMHKVNFSQTVIRLTRTCCFASSSKRGVGSL